MASPSAAVARRRSARGAPRRRSDRRAGAVGARLGLRRLRRQIIIEGVSVVVAAARCRRLKRRLVRRAVALRGRSSRRRGGERRQRARARTAAAASASAAASRAAGRSAARGGGAKYGAEPLPPRPSRERRPRARRRRRAATPTSAAAGAATTRRWRPTSSTRAVEPHAVLRGGARVDRLAAPVGAGGGDGALAADVAAGR